MEADYDDFIIHDTYHEAVPRPTYEENRALDLKLIERGQLEPIRVNRKMWILDGYTRHDLLGQRGKKIKYEFMDFETEEEELTYVIETNVMRRHLNHYQKLETIHKLYKKIKAEPQSRFMDTWYNIIKSVKDGSNTVEAISKDTGHHRVHVNKTLHELEEKYYVRIEKKWQEFESKNGRGGMRNFCTILPKAEEFISKYEKREKGGANVILGKITGIHRCVVAKGIVVIDKADRETKELLREGKLSISGVYGDLTRCKKSKVGEKHLVWGKYTKIKCPSCDHIATKSEYIKVEV